MLYNRDMINFVSIEQRKTEEILRIIQTLETDLYISDERKERLEVELTDLVKQRDLMRETLKKYKR